MEETGNSSKTNNASCSDDTDVVFSCVIRYIRDSRDRAAVSTVCSRWRDLEALTREHVTIPFCYTTTPKKLQTRFKNLKSLKLKGQPQAAMFSALPENWGGFVKPWVEEIVTSFNRLTSLHFRRMIVKDWDLEHLARSRGRNLEHLKLDKCSGFSTDGLLHVARDCRQLKTLFLEGSKISEKDGDWLHQLALNNAVLETLNFYMTVLNKIRHEDLDLIAINCQSLITVKISYLKNYQFLNFLCSASRLEEFGGGSLNGGQRNNYSNVKFPEKLCRLGLTYVATDEIPVVFPLASVLKKLDLRCVSFNREDQCDLIQRCLNLEILEARPVIGNRGMEILASSCKHLKRLRIDVDRRDGETQISHMGLIDLAHGCRDLEYISVCVCDVTNLALEKIGYYLKNLKDFRLILCSLGEITNLPLDNGVKALLRGCLKLQRFDLQLQPGQRRGLTNKGLRYIGQYSTNVKRMQLSYVGESDEGILEFVKGGCPNLQKLKIKSCPFSESVLAEVVMRLSSLKYLWVQDFIPSKPEGSNLVAMARPFWIIELMRDRMENRNFGLGSPYEFWLEFPPQILAYYSLAERRTDFPAAVEIVF